MSTKIKPEVAECISEVQVKVSCTCVLNLTRPSSNPEKPIVRQYLAKAGDTVRISTSHYSPVTIGVIPFEPVPESILVND